MPAQAPTRFMNDVYDEYPDDETSKNVYLQADGHKFSEAGDRHVLIWWSNGEYAPGCLATQIVQLSGNSGNYAYYSPLVKKSPSESTDTSKNQQFLMGCFTRTMRDQLLTIAGNTPFVRSSTVNGCRVWTKDLLQIMVKEGIIDQIILEDIHSKVPLKKRIEEI